MKVGSALVGKARSLSREKKEESFFRSLKKTLFYVNGRKGKEQTSYLESTPLVSSFHVW